MASNDHYAGTRSGSWLALVNDPASVGVLFRFDDNFGHECILYGKPNTNVGAQVGTTSVKDPGMT